MCCLPKISQLQIFSYISLFRTFTVLLSSGKSDTSFLPQKWLHQLVTWNSLCLWVSVPRSSLDREVLSESRYNSVGVLCAFGVSFSSLSFFSLLHAAESLCCFSMEVWTCSEKGRAFLLICLYKQRTIKMSSYWKEPSPFINVFPAAKGWQLSPRTEAQELHALGWMHWLKV